MSREPLIPQPLRYAVAQVPSAPKRAILRTMYAAAIAQRRHGERQLAVWPRPRVSGDLDATVATLSCERDRLAVTRMASSLLSTAGRPRRLLIVSDSSITPATRRALEALDGCIEVPDWRELTEPARLPAAVRRYAAVHPMGKKLAMLMSLAQWPAVVLDSDIEFFRGGHRLGELVRAGGAHRYQQTRGDAYDTRLLDGLTPVPGVCAGCLVLRGPLSWDQALERLEPVADSGGAWTEQTMVAIALSAARAEPLPAEDYVVCWDDLGVPWDSVAGRDVVLRHYAAWIGLWKLWMRGGPAGYRSLPLAVGRELLPWMLSGSLVPGRPALEAL